MVKRYKLVLYLLFFASFIISLAATVKPYAPILSKSIIYHGQYPAESNPQTTPSINTYSKATKTIKHKATETPLKVPPPITQNLKITIIGLGTFAIIVVLFGLWLNRKNLEPATRRKH